MTTWWISEHADGVPIAVAYTCPGCDNWQVEFVRPQNFISEVRLAHGPVLTAVDDHRAECPAFDMLAGLAGVPT